MKSRRPVTEWACMASLFKTTSGVEKGEPMPMKVAFPTLRYAGDDAEAQLRRLNLDREGLLWAVRQGEEARMQATAFDPLIAAGLDAYRYRVRALRERFCIPGGWTVLRNDGLELMLSPSGKSAIMTRAGDSGVGLWDAHPQPLNEVGGSTRAALARNQNLYLDPSWMNVETDEPQLSKYELWMLLVHRSQDLVRAELSLSTGLNRDAPSWRTRILLPEIDYTPKPTGRSLTDATSKDPAFDAPLIKRR
jgi:hypothetical protein